MRWVRKHVKTGARLALIALAVQFVLSFGHFHPLAAQAAPVRQIAASQSDLLAAATAAQNAAHQFADRQQQAPGQDNDQQPADFCAICAVMAMANSVLFATPPALLLPQQIELTELTTNAVPIHHGTRHHAFQSRAPPLS